MADRDISLLPKDKFQETLWGKLMAWLLSVGRYIVIFTELIVIGAFLSRFWLDRKNADLSEEIRQQQAILESTSDFENEFRLFQTRLKAISNAQENSKDLSTYLDLVTGTMPTDITVLSYSLSEDETTEVSVLTLVYSEVSLANFVNDLLKMDEVSSVRIGAIEREQGITGMKIQFMISFSGLGKETKNG